MSKAWKKRDKESAKVGSKTDLQLRKRVCFHVFNPMTCQMFIPIDSVIDSSKRSQAAMPSVQSNFEKAPTSKQARKISENTFLSIASLKPSRCKRKHCQKKCHDTQVSPTITFHDLPVSYSNLPSVSRLPLLIQISPVVEPISHLCLFVWETLPWGKCLNLLFGEVNPYNINFEFRSLTYFIFQYISSLLVFWKGAISQNPTV